MSFLVYFFIFLFGLAVGSFLNCIIYRLEEGESFLRGRSFCPHCGHILSFGDLIPVLSFLILKGKCRYCSQKISWQYPLVEISTGLLFISLLNLTQVRPVYFYLLLMGCFLIIIFVYDLKYYIIPDKIIYPAIVIAFLYTLRDPASLMKPGLTAAFLASAFFLIIVILSRGKWMGIGDIKLAFLIGLILGWPKILPALFLAFLIGAIIGIGLIVAGKKTLKSEVPFGPFLVIGTFIAIFFGDEIINFYLKFYGI